MVRIAMPRPQDNTRIDLGELKAQIVKKIGVEKSRRYFSYLSRFLCQKLTKSEFDKSCHRLLGRENLSLHNQLIRSTLRNASLAKSPPSHLPKALGQAAAQDSRNGEEQRGSVVPNHSQNGFVWSNGVIPVSPRNVRSLMRDRKIRERPSPLGPNGKVEHMLHNPSCKGDNDGVMNMENGDLGHFDRQNPCNNQAAMADTKDYEHKEEQARLNMSRTPLIAPLGIPICSARTGGVRRKASVDWSSCYDSGGLSDSIILRKRMENIAVGQGLGGVSMECANTLNNMLDVYLKKLIKSCIDLVGSKSAKGAVSDKQQIQNKVVNGVWLSNNNNLQDITQEQRSVSLLDFRVAMDLLDPNQLGQDWPLIRERICMRAFEERELGL